MKRSSQRTYMHGPMNMNWGVGGLSEGGEGYQLEEGAKGEKLGQL